MTTSHQSYFRPACLAAAAFVAALAAAELLPAQTTDDDQGYLAVVTTDNTPIRAGNATSYYCLGKAKAGSMVKVNGTEKYRFFPVATVGPTFKDYFGYVRQPHGKADLLRIAPDGKTALTLGQVDVEGAYLDEETGTYRPDESLSWKPLVTLKVEQPLRVLETLDLPTGLVYRVALPETCTAWIHGRNIRRATAEEIEAWEAALIAEKQARQQKPQTPGEVRAAPEAGQQALAQEEPILPPVAEPDSTPAEPPTTPSGQPTTPGEVSPPAGEQAAETAPPLSAAEIVEDAQPTPVDEAELARAALEDLEAAFELLKQEPIEKAEVSTLRQLYLDLVQEHAGDATVARFADQRARQLAIWEEIQRRKVELAMVRARADVTSEQAQAVRLAMAHSADYVAVGRLDASTIYDGQRLPQLFRLQDAGTGRTIAYIRPTEGFDLVGMLGQLVGIAGEKAYDGGLRLNLIKPTQIDSLTPR
ncbi:MAG: hypothetical protein JSV91_13505 [Phycisphaerales bacterium]|nr:MAG: hypothetical protein JSV91_13505 [Phycisphaerales bacterium]